MHRTLLALLLALPLAARASPPPPGLSPHPIPAPAPALAPIAADVVLHGSRTAKLVALTFDACSTRSPSRYDERVTKVLVDTHTPATIFLGGHWAQEEAEHVKYLASLPQFELANHTYSHPHLKKQTDARIREELLETQAVLQDLVGRQPAVFRPPYGEYDARVAKIAGEAGLRTIEYDLASGDPDKHATRERLRDWVLLKAKPGSIVVMHINHLKFHTSEALPEIIAGLRKRGFELVTVSELLRRSAAPPVVAK
jgi:peptidoglycan/xylan/chitin deacetylase (PgdA/CDA1 family)